MMSITSCHIWLYLLVTLTACFHLGAFWQTVSNWQNLMGQVGMVCTCCKALFMLATFLIWKLLMISEWGSNDWKFADFCKWFQGPTSNFIKILQNTDFPTIILPMPPKYTQMHFYNTFRFFQFRKLWQVLQLFAPRFFTSIIFADSYREHLRILGKMIRYILLF